MLRSAAGKVMWVGRATVFLVGLAVILALAFGAATTAMGATGGNFILGKANAASKASKLTASVAGPALNLVNQSTQAAATALNISVASGQAPLKVNAEAGTATGLSADELDGKDSAEFLAADGKARDAAALDGKAAGEFATQAGLDSEAGARQSADSGLDARTSDLETDVGVLDAKQVIDDYGNQPLEGTYTSKGGKLVISASGSGYSGTHNIVGVYIEVDGYLVGSMRVYANELNQHEAFSSGHLVVDRWPPTGGRVPAGEHTITLRPYQGTLYNLGDLFQVSVVEVPY